MTTQSGLLKAQRFGAGKVAMQLWYRMVQGASGDAKGFGTGLARLAKRRSSVVAHTATHATAIVSEDTLVASELFAQAVRDNSNLELDWLWQAGRLSSPAERRYCYQRALVINPACEQAHRALSSI
ncbi:MAG: hypothetical protein H7Y32_06320 [Chloroflexales bacterium]|nr:hypothetical protein [Chloroflexales bacterium]